MNTAEPLMPTKKQWPQILPVKPQNSTSPIRNTSWIKKDIRAKSFYNKGVILSQQKNLEESIEAYKNAIRLDPSDKQARENLQKALLELRKKNAAPKKDNKQDKKKQDPKQQKQPQSRMSQKETEQRLKLPQPKEKEVQQRLQRDKAGEGGSRPKDW